MIDLNKYPNMAAMLERRDPNRKPTGHTPQPVQWSGKFTTGVASPEELQYRKDNAATLPF